MPGTAQKENSGEFTKSKFPSTAEAASPFADGTLGAPVSASAAGGRTLHNAAKNDRARGTILNYLLEAKEEISQWTRLETLKKVRVLKANNGIVERILDGSAQMCGALTPRPATADADWNKLAEEAWRQGTAKGILTACGKYGIEEFQAVAYSHTFRDGDFFAALSESEETRRAQLHLYEGHQCGNNPHAADKNDGFHDGVRADKSTRALAYRLLHPQEKRGEKRRHVDVPARDIVAFIEYRLRAGQLRGLSRLAHGVGHFQDTDEILRFIKMGSKASQMLAMSITSTPEVQEQGRGLASGLYKATAAGSHGDIPAGAQTTPETEDDWKKQARRQIENQDAYDGAMVLDIPEGSRLAMEHDRRPHPDVLSALDWIISHASVGFGLRPELIWDIARLGGANTRYILSDAATWVEKRQEWMRETFLRRFWVYLIAKEMRRWDESGGSVGLPPCKDPAWWKCLWLAPLRQSVDFGRDGKLYLQQLGSGNMTRSRWYGLQGLNAEEQDKALIAEIAERQQWCAEQGVDYHRAFPAPPSSTGIILPGSEE